MDKKSLTGNEVYVLGLHGMLIKSAEQEEQTGNDSFAHSLREKAAKLIKVFGLEQEVPDGKSV